jgi:hypothetical protein
MYPRDAFEASFRGLPLFPSAPPPAITAAGAVEEGRAILRRFARERPEDAEFREELRECFARAEVEVRRIQQTLLRIDQRAAAKRKAAATRKGTKPGACRCRGSCRRCQDDREARKCAEFLLGSEVCRGLSAAECRRRVDAVSARWARWPRTSCTGWCRAPAPRR